MDALIWLVRSILGWKANKSAQKTFALKPTEALMDPRIAGNPRIYQSPD